MPSPLGHTAAVMKTWIFLESNVAILKLDVLKIFRSWQDLNLQSPDPKSGALSTRPNMWTKVFLANWFKQQGQVHEFSFLWTGYDSGLPTRPVTVNLIMFYLNMVNGELPCVLPPDPLKIIGNIDTTLSTIYPNRVSITFPEKINFLDFSKLTLLFIIGHSWESGSCSSIFLFSGKEEFGLWASH